MILTTELSKDHDVVTICLDKDGIDFLIKKLIKLSNSKSNEHDHLMTPSWSGNELTEKKIGADEDTLINHLRLVFLNEKATS